MFHLEMTYDIVQMVDDLLSVQLITLWAKEGQRDNLIYRPYSYTPFAAIRNNIHQQLPVYLFTCFIVDLNQIKKQVDENEPGTTKYFMGTSKEDPNEIWLWEEVSHFRLLIFTRLNMDKACWPLGDL